MICHDFALLGDEPLVDFVLAEEHSADRVGSLQTAQDRRVEHAALVEFLKAHEEGRLMSFFLDQSVAADWIERAYARHARLTLSSESVSVVWVSSAPATRVA